MMNTRQLQIGEAVIANADWALDPLERLTQMQGARNYLDAKIEEAVREARTETRWQGSHIDHVPGRANGLDMQEVPEFRIASWEQIATALGGTRQAAHRKYAPLMEG